MSLRPQVIYLVPEETARVARAAFPKGNLYLRMYDALGSIFADRQFADLFPARGQAAEAPVRLALATILQFAEGLSDRQAADAVRSRLDSAHPRDTMHSMINPSCAICGRPFYCHPAATNTADRLVGTSCGVYPTTTLFQYGGTGAIARCL